MKTKQFILSLIVIAIASVMTFAFTTIPKEPNKSSTFDSPYYDEAKEIYSQLRVTQADPIKVNNIEAWKEYEKFMIDTHWNEIKSNAESEGLIVVDSYWNPIRNKWFPITQNEDGSLIYHYQDSDTVCGWCNCGGMNCECGCCATVQAFNTGGIYCYKRCCGCIIE